MQERIPNEPVKLWNRNYILVLMLSACSNAASMMVTPLLMKYALSIDIPITKAAAVMSLFSVVALVLRPASGYLSDRFNRKSILLAATFGIAVSLFGYSLVNGAGQLTVVRLLHGVVFSFSSVGLMSFNAQFIPKEKLGEGMGWMSLAHILAYSLGPNIGLALAEHFSYRICFMSAAAVCLVSFTIILCIPYRHTAPAPESLRKFDINNLISLTVLPYAVLTGLWSCGNGLENNYLALLGEERGIASVGLFFTAYSIALVLVRPISGKIFDKLGIKTIMYPALFITFAGNMLLGFATSIWFFVIAGIMKALGQGSGSPAIHADCIKKLGREKAGVISSTCYIGQDIGNALAPVAGSYVVAGFGYKGVFTGYAIIFIVVGTLLFFLKSSYDDRKARIQG